MVDAIVSFAIQKLGDFIAQEVNVRIGVRDGVRWLKDELGLLQPTINKAESRQEEDEIIRNWVNSVRDVANEAVAILSRYALQQEHAAQKQGILDRFRGCVCIFKKEAMFYDIGKDIESLKGRIVDIKNRRIEYGIDNILATPNVQQKRRTFLRTTAINNQVDVIGFEDDIKTLMGELNSENPSLKVISIHGMGGLGKTSLATKLYNSSENFDTRAKVCVSNEYNLKDVLKRIVKSFMGPEHEQYLSNMDEHDLVQYLPKLLQDRGRYLALIDDIWDIKAWDQIKIAFPDLKNGSRIIITTRNKRVAEIVDDKCFVHHPLRFLTEEESWQLFCKRAKPTTPNMEKLAREMVGKCRGLPLAIVVLSGLLLHNMTYDNWSKVKDQMWRQLKKKGGSFQIEEILSLSYNDLLPQMRDCFLYLARYPEDHVIYSNELKLLWTAEEFISEAEEGEGVVMEDLAEDYLNELINRNLLQAEDLRLNGQVRSCRVHDLVRDLAINKAKEHKLLAIFDSGKHHPDVVHLLEGQPRHIIYNGIGEYLKLLERRFDALCSLAVSENFSGKVELKEMKLVCTRFKHLKVLDMRSVDSERIPEEIGNLVLLKFLGLMGGQRYSHKIPIEIPPSIAKLKKLQTLLGSDKRRYTVPTEICELHELRCLDINVSGRLNIGDHQTKLHTLRIIRGGVEDGNGYTMESIANLTSLQILCLEFCRAVIPTMKPLSSCNRLKSVTLWGTLKDPSELYSLPDSVTDLSLFYSGFTEDPMPTLGSLSNLTALQLQTVYAGNKMVCSHNAFPSLQILRLQYFHYLEELEVKDGAFPSLKQFRTQFCVRLKKIPLELESLWGPYI